MNIRSMLAPRSSARLVFAQLACACALLGGCGGGGPDTAGTGSSGPRSTSFAAGPITGFGSVIVNGVRAPAAYGQYGYGATYTAAPDGSLPAPERVSSPA